MAATRARTPCPPAGPRLWLLPAACLALAALLWGTGWNRELFLWLNGGWGDAAWWSRVTVLGDALVVLVLLLPFAGRRPDVLWAALAATVLAVLAVHGLKGALDLPRPAAVLPAGWVEVIGPLHRRGSFPSGHTASAFTLAGVLVFCLGRPLAWGLLLPAALVALSRVMVGAHWPADLLGGAAVGWLAAAGGTWIAARLPAGRGPGVQRLLALGLLAAAAGLWFFDSGYPQARGLQRAIALGAPLAALPGLWRLFARRPDP